MARFFVSCPIYFEESLANEMKSFWFEMMDMDGQPTRSSLPELRIEPGGIEIECADHLGYQINFFSKIALRVLVRIAKFNARFFDQFEAELQKVPLDKYLNQKNIQFKIETAKSRLNHERNLIEAATKALAKIGYKIDDKASQKLFVRIVKDHAVVSLDTSGENLHRRGYAIYRGEAPLRENLAALMVQQLLKLGADLRRDTFVDPFVGSGTTLYEVASFFSPNFQRDYSWLHFKNKPKMFDSPSWKKNYRWLQVPVKSQLVGIDIDEKAIANFKQNKIEFDKHFDGAALRLVAIPGDSLTVNLAMDPLESTWIIANPPYGMRLKQDSVPAILKHIEQSTSARGAVVLHPESIRIDFATLKLSSQLDFSNQGLKIKLSVFSR